VAIQVTLEQVGTQDTAEVVQVDILDTQVPQVIPDIQQILATVDTQA
jgi:hypothetical protein